MEHLEQHGTFENYFHYKSRLIRHADEKTAVILNVDAPLIEGLIEKTNGDVFTAGIEKDASIGIEAIDLSTGFAKFNYVVRSAHHSECWSLEPMVLPIQLEVAGYHSVLNAMIAITYGLLEGVDGAVIQKAMQNFSGVERLSLIHI